MKNKLIRIFSLCLMVVLFAVALASCGQTSAPQEIVLTATGGVTGLPRGSSVQLIATCKKLSQNPIVYEVVSGEATVSDTGLLTIHADAVVDSEVSVVAKVDGATSPALTLKVLPTNATAITLSSDFSSISVGGHVVITVHVTPSEADNKAYTLTILDGSDIATITQDGRLTLNDGVAEDDIVNRRIKVQATLNADNAVAGTIDIAVVRAQNVDQIAVENVEWIAGKSAAAFVRPVAYNVAGYELSDIKATDYAYISDNESILTVGADGAITPKAHGSAVVTVRYANGVEAKCRVTVIVPPEALTLTGYNQKIIADARHEFSYGMQDALTLSTLSSHFQYQCAQALTYAFATDTLSGDDVATVDADGRITFKVTGTVKVTVTSNSSLNGVDTSALEKSLVVYVNVNDGINADSVADLLAYSQQYDKTIVNLTGNITLTATENFGILTDAGGTEFQYASLAMYGDRTFLGNGYSIDLDALPVRADFRSQRVALLYFAPVPGASGQPFTVQVKDLSVKGAGGISGVSNTTAGNDQSLLAPVGDGGALQYTCSYGMAIQVKGHSYANNYRWPTSYPKAYAKNFVMDNVSVVGFDVGMRIEHAVDGKMSNIYVNDCYSNGIELIQNTMTLHNMDFGTVGAFCIEATPDDMKAGETGEPILNSSVVTQSPAGTAGKNYNQTQTLRFTGTLNSQSYNNGGTPYLVNDFNLDLQAATSIPGLTVTQLIQSMISSAVQKEATDMGADDAKAQLAMQMLLAACMKDGTSMNFFIMMFVDFTQYPGYATKGNTEGLFCKYEYDGFEDMITVSQIIRNAMDNDPTNDYDFTTKKYILMDLIYYQYNIGQIIMLNQAYTGE